jgi:chemotaxis protein MotB
MAREKRKGKAKGSPEWLTTWGDMCTLLLCFFVFFYNIVEAEGRMDLGAILWQMQGSFGRLPGGNTFSKGRLAEMGMTVTSLPAQETGRALSRSVKQAVSIFRPQIAAKKVRVTEDERGIIISLASDSYFDQGSAKLRPEGRPVLEKVARLLNHPDIDDRNVRIEGHTDEVDIDKAREQYDTNWELSTMRAVSVLKMLENGLTGEHVERERMPREAFPEGSVERVMRVDPRRLSAAGYGRYRPVESNLTPEGRAYNRRVDVIILREPVR